ncbi:MAG: hypothetical protein MUF81_17235 [Verrucomicrobia bacterium]|jgi:hypothetical protein|nr:hypothetical protein [Verrucomicrobiota bacterium]
MNSKTTWITLGLLASLPSVQACRPRHCPACFSRYTGVKNEGIQVAGLDVVTGQFGASQLAAASKSSAFLAVI